MDFYYPWGYSSRRSAVMATGGMVATSQPLAARAGLRMLEDGGTAADAAVDVCQRSMELFGGAGIMFENERPMQKYLRDALSFLHSDGTQTAHKLSAMADIREHDGFPA